MKPTLLTTVAFLLFLVGCDDSQRADGEDSRMDTAALPSPTDLFGMHTSAGYRLGWSDEASTEDGFRIERRSSGEEGYLPLIELGPDITEYVDTNRSPDVDYWYRLSAFREDETSEYVTLDSSLQLWTYIRIYDYDDIWGMEGSPAEELAKLESVMEADMAIASLADNLTVVCLGDAYGEGGSYYAADMQLLSQPELDMADPSTYENFIDWVLEHHPGQRYVVEYWGHGGGAGLPDGALGYDATSGHGGLSPAEMDAVLGYLSSRTGKPVDLLFLCTCLNSTVENAYEWRNNVRWLVAGETTVGCGFYPIEPLINNASLSPEELALETVEGYRSTVVGEGFNVVYSAIELEHTPSLATAIDELARALLTFISASSDNVERVKTAAEQTLAMGSIVGDFAMAYVDLYDLCLELISRIEEATIVAACEEIMDLLDGRVVVDFAASDPGHYDDAHGVSILHPNSRYPDYYWPGAAEYYGQHSLSMDTQWDEYIFALHPPL